MGMDGDRGSEVWERCMLRGLVFQPHWFLLLLLLLFSPREMSPLIFIGMNMDLCVNVHKKHMSCISHT